MYISSALPKSVVLSCNYHQKNICKCMIYVYHSHTLILIHHFEFPFSATRFRSFVSNFIYRHIKQSITRRAATTKATATRQTGQQFAIVACFDKCYEYAVAVVLVDALLFSVHSPYGSLCHELSM